MKIEKYKHEVCPTCKGKNFVPASLYENKNRVHGNISSNSTPVLCRTCHI